MAYQDVIDERGEVIEEGYRSCADRYEAVRKIAEQLRRPFTVLDLGAASGYFSYRLTQDFGARCVAVDASADVRHVQGKIAAVVQQRVSAEDIRRLGTFDMVLGLSFLHHVPNWRAMLAMMNKITRSALVVETPNPAERLRSAVNRFQLDKIQERLETLGMHRIAGAPSVWDRGLTRGLYVLRRDGLPTEGKVFSGSGNNGLHTTRFQDELAGVLGYRPFPGSMNIRTKYAFRLGAYSAEYVDARRGRGGRRGGDYQVWHAQIEGWDGPAHVMRPGVRGHGRYVLEVWAPVKLKEHLGLKDGDTVRLRIGA